MFSNGSSSSEENESFTATPFNAITAAAVARRDSLQKRPFPRVKAAVEDLDAFEYDQLQLAADEQRRAIPQPTRKERKSRYIGKLVVETERRAEELARVRERQLLREQQLEDAQYPGKEKFVTKGYRREIEKREEEERKEMEEMERDRGDAREVVRRVFLRRGNVDSNQVHADNIAGQTTHDEEGKTTSRASIAHNGQSKRNDEAKRLEEESSNAAGDSGKKRRRRQFDVVGENRIDLAEITQEHAQVVSGEAEKDRGVVIERKKRGLRRNDEESISAYRGRYFERMERRRRDGDPLYYPG